MTDEDNRKLVKVVFRVEADDEVRVETPWAREVGPNEYELDNLPWYAYGISCGDIFEATPCEGDPRPQLVRVLRKSGNRTVRMAFTHDEVGSGISTMVLEELRRLGCSYEGVSARYVAVNVPAASSLARVCAYLTEQGVEWEHADPEWEEAQGHEL